MPRSPGTRFFDEDKDPGVPCTTSSSASDCTCSRMAARSHTLSLRGRGRRERAGLELHPAADFRRGWRPGGYQLFTVDAVRQRLFVGMHPGAHEGSHKTPAAEIWVVDLKERKRVSRSPGRNAVAMTLSHGANAPAVRARWHDQRPGGAGPAGDEAGQAARALRRHRRHAHPAGGALNGDPARPRARPCCRSIAGPAACARRMAQAARHRGFPACDGGLRDAARAGLAACREADRRWPSLRRRPCCCTAPLASRARRSRCWSCSFSPSPACTVCARAAASSNAAAEAGRA